MSVAHVVLVLIAAACFVLTVGVVVMLVRAPTVNPPSPPVEEPFNVTVWVPPSEMDTFWAIMAGMPDVEDTYNTILQEQP